MISAGRVTVVDDTGPVQKLQVTERPGPDGSLAVTDKVIRVAQFGFTSSPPVSSEVVLVRLWGNRTLTIALGTNHQPSRLKNLSPGDAALYDERGAYAWFTPAGLVVDAAGNAVTIQNFSTCLVKGDLHVTGDVIAKSASSPVSLAGHDHGMTGGSNTTAPLPQ